MLDDKDVVKNSDKFVRIIIRRPQAYTFRKNHDKAPIPGVAFLDGEGDFKGSHNLVEEGFAELMKKLSAP